MSQVFCFKTWYSNITLLVPLSKTLVPVLWRNFLFQCFLCSLDGFGRTSFEGRFLSSKLGLCWFFFLGVSAPDSVEHWDAHSSISFDFSSPVHSVLLSLLLSFCFDVLRFLGFGGKISGSAVGSAASTGLLSELLLPAAGVSSCFASWCVFSGVPPLALLPLPFPRPFPLALPLPLPFLGPSSSYASSFHFASGSSSCSSSLGSPLARDALLICCWAWMSSDGDDKCRWTNSRSQYVWSFFDGEKYFSCFFSIGFLVQGFVYQHYYGSGQKIKDEDPQRNPRDTPACMHACMQACMMYVYIYKCIPCMLYAWMHLIRFQASL